MIERIKSNMPLPHDTDKIPEKPARKRYIDYFVDRKYPTDGFKDIFIPYLWPKGKKRPEIFIKYSNLVRQIGKEYKLFNTGGWTITKDGIRGRGGILIIDSQKCKWIPYL